MNRPDDSGFTALLWACAYGQTITMEYLLEKGANIQHSGNHGENSLLLASCHGYTDIVSQLVSLGMSVNYTDEVSVFLYILMIGISHDLRLHIDSI